MIVVDTNIVGYLYFPSAFTENVEELQLRDKDWIAPVLWKSEFLNVASLYYRKKLISLPDTLEAFERANEFVITFDVHSEYHNILNLVASSGCTAYDCEFVALAQSLAAKLITYDRELKRQFPGIVSTPEEYLSR